MYMLIFIVRDSVADRWTGVSVVKLAGLILNDAHLFFVIRPLSEQPFCMGIDSMVVDMT